MLRKIKKIDDDATLMRDDRMGIAVIHNGRDGLNYTLHPSIDKTGSVRGMKKLGYWGCSQCPQWALNVSSYLFHTASQPFSGGCIFVSERSSRDFGIHPKRAEIPVYLSHPDGGRPFHLSEETSCRTCFLKRCDADAAGTHPSCRKEIQQHQLPPRLSARSLFRRRCSR